MLRVFFAAFVLATAIAVLGGSPEAAGVIFVVLFVLLTLGSVGKLKCQYCRKRVKLGASVCHHCGRDVKSWAERLLEWAEQRAKDKQALAELNKHGAEQQTSFDFASQGNQSPDGQPALPVRRFDRADDDRPSADKIRMLGAVDRAIEEHKAQSNTPAFGKRNGP